jgi:hypothetical protein
MSLSATVLIDMADGSSRQMIVGWDARWMRWRRCCISWTHDLG